MAGARAARTRATSAASRGASSRSGEGELSADDDPHRGQPVLHRGAPLSAARAIMVMVHGRGASAEDILTLRTEFQHPELAFLAPQAAGQTWYPYSFLAPLDQNEPWLSSGLGILGDVIEEIDSSGPGVERTVLLGFSQGACLALEFAARNAKRYGAVVGFTGGLIGPAGTPRGYAGSFDRTPVFLGTSDPDPHVPLARVRETAAVLEQMGAVVEFRSYPGMGHTINSDEAAAANRLVTRLLRDEA